MICCVCFFLKLCDLLVPLASFEGSAVHTGSPSAPSFPTVAIADDICCYFRAALEAVKIRSVLSWMWGFAQRCSGRDYLFTEIVFLGGTPLAELSVRGVSS